MRYLIASSGADLNAKVSNRFGHAEYFIVLDSETGQFEAVPGVGHDEAAHGIDRFKKQNIEKVIVGNIGPGAFQDLKDHGWTAYLCRNMTINQAVEQVEKGAIPALEESTLKKSIHSARDAHGRHHEHGQGRGHGEGGGGLGRGRHSL